jgi:predicted acylesterase/phospholipase RssA
MGRHIKLGLALGGGGARGMAHIGVLKVLESKNIPMSMIVGTSIGALVGAAYAANPDAEALKQRLLEVLGLEGDDAKGLKSLYNVSRKFRVHIKKPVVFRRLPCPSSYQWSLNKTTAVSVFIIYTPD